MTVFRTLPERGHLSLGVSSLSLVIGLMAGLPNVLEAKEPSQNPSNRRVALQGTSLLTRLVRHIAALSVETLEPARSCSRSTA